MPCPNIPVKHLETFHTCWPRMLDSPHSTGDLATRRSSLPRAFAHRCCHVNFGGFKHRQVLLYCTHESRESDPHHFPRPRPRPRATGHEPSVLASLHGATHTASLPNFLLTIQVVGVLLWIRTAAVYFIHCCVLGRPATTSGRRQRFRMVLSGSVLPPHA